MTNTRIWKYELKFAHHQTLCLQEKFKILTIQLQDGHPMLWALIESEFLHKEVEPSFKKIEILGLYTGDVNHNMHNAKYISTVQELDGTVIHYFWR